MKTVQVQRWASVPRRALQGLLVGAVASLLIVTAAYADAPTLTAVAAHEPLTVVYKTGPVTYPQSGVVAPAIPIYDIATLSGGDAPTGTMTFTLFYSGASSNAPADCTDQVFTSSVTVSGPGTYKSVGFTPTVTGTYRFIAAYSGDDRNVAVTSGCDDDSQRMIVMNPAATTLTPQITATDLAVGGTVTFSVVLSGGYDPLGTITFYSYSPGDTGCGNLHELPRYMGVSGNRAYGTAFTVDRAGTWRFAASYTGDPMNAGTSTHCNEPGTTVEVPKTSTALTGSASTSVPVGGTLFDTVVLSGGTQNVLPTGVIRFDLFGPDDALCVQSPAFTSTVPAYGSHSYTSPSFTPATVGTYRFVATYSGDGNNVGSATQCSDVAQQVVVTPPVPTTKDQCKHHGWAEFVDADGHPFKNQGDCESFTLKGRAGKS